MTVGPGSHFRSSLEDRVVGCGSDTLRAPMARLPSLTVAIHDELYSTSNVKGAGLFEAMREAARARGFHEATGPESPELAVLSTTAAGGKNGARVRGDFGAHGQPIAAAAARVLGAPVTVIVVAGDAVAEAGAFRCDLTTRAVQVDRTGKTRILRLEDAPAPAPEAIQVTHAADVARLAHERADRLLLVAMAALRLAAIEPGAATRVLLRRPTGTPRVEELASLIATASGHELARQPDGRYLLRVSLGDGKRMAFLTAAEADELTKRLAR